MQLVPIKGKPEDFKGLSEDPLFPDIVKMTFEYYPKVGFHEPWIGYLARENEVFVGMGGFKGQPVNGAVEIAYGTFENFQNQGIGAKICKLLVELALATDPGLTITARTLPEHNFSTRILQKNDFVYSGTVLDPEDGEVWEWVFIPS